MELYVVGSKKDFNEEQLKRLEGLGQLIFIEEVKDKYNEQYVTSNEEKIIVLDPDLVGWEFPNDLIEKINNLKAICLMSTAFNYIDIDFCNEKGIVVTNVPKYSTNSVAEYASFLMMAVARKLPLQMKNGPKDDYADTYCGTQVRDKKIGIIGLGTIGTRVAEILTGMGMEVLYWSRTKRDSRFKYVELEELFKSVDFIFPTFSINEDTLKIITDSLINSMKPSASIISIVGTDCMNKELVLNKVKENQLYGFAFESDKESINDYEGNVMITPHYAWYTKDSLENCIEIWVQSVEGIAKGNLVNVVKN